MIIKNNTGNIVEIGYYDRFNVSMKQRICIRPHGTCEVSPKDGIILSDIELNKCLEEGVISVVGRNPVELLPEVNEVSEVETSAEPVIPQEEYPPVESPSEDASLEGETHEEVSETNDESAFICEVCGKEFASSRGLNKHMKSHAS